MSPVRVRHRLRGVEVRCRGLDGVARPEIEPFGIHTTVVEPGFFRTELLTKESTIYARASIEDYAERNAAQREFWESMNGQQGGDPAKLAHALMTLTASTRRRSGSSPAPTRSLRPRRSSPNARPQIDAHRDLSSSLALETAEPAA